jgi:diguanylate cyclase (GGDEF)-like protein
VASAPASGHKVLPGLRAHRFALRLGGCFFSVALSTAFLRLFSGQNRLFLVSSCIWLVYLLLTPHNRWPVYLGIGFAAQVLGGLLVHPHFESGLLLATLDLGGVSLSAAILRRVAVVRPASTAGEFRRPLTDAIHQASPDGILIVDNQANVVVHNRRFADVWRIDIPQESAGWQQSTDLADQQLLEQAAARTKDPERFAARINEIYANRETEDHCEIELKDGRTLERYTTYLRSDEGSYLGRIWFFRDVSDRKIAEKKLEDAYHAVEALAITDSLTGLANRRRFDQCLVTEWRRGMRDRSPLSLLLIDADLFKAYNDTYGHLRGDSCLRQIAEAAQDVVARPGDLVARFGGEEFAVLLPNTENEGAAHIAEEICAAMRARELPHKSAPHGIVTVSVGCVTLIPHLGQNSANLIEFADEALYDAKRSGRNRVCNCGSVDGVPRGLGLHTVAGRKMA